jgi:CxxC-x17-CxxC domain-containing protein
MGHFNKFDKGRGGRGFGGGNFNGPKQMYSATCSTCGKPCEVPFKPLGDRPVFCKDCFRSQRDGAAISGPKFPLKSVGGGADSAMGGGITKGSIDSLHTKLDKILAILTAGGMAEAPKTDAAEVMVKKDAPIKKTSSGKKTSSKKSKSKKK